MTHNALNVSLNSSKERNESDLYSTPYCLTREVLDRESLDISKSILEPACGNNAIVKVLNEKGFTNITAYDKEVDFLKETKQYDVIITNPPFNLSQEFILKCKDIAREKFILLFPLSYLHGKKRYLEIFSKSDYKLEKVYVFTRSLTLDNRPLREDGKVRNGMMIYAWYVWNKEYKGNPEIEWIENSINLVKK